MTSVLQLFSDFAPLSIFIAAILDILFLSGYFLYGATTTALILMLYGSGAISTPEIIVYALLGTLTGNMFNFCAGRYFSSTKTVSRILRSEPVQKIKTFLRTRGLFLFILIGRFTTLTRPLYALIAGALHIPVKQFILYESGIALVWVTAWLWIMITGFDTIMWLKDTLF